MDTRHPHAIVDGAELAKMPEAERKHFRPITQERARMLLAMTSEQRGAWLREHPIDAALVERIRREERKHSRRKRRKTEEVLSRGSKRRTPESVSDMLRDEILRQAENGEANA